MTLCRTMAAITVLLGLATGNIAGATPILGVPVAGAGEPVSPSFGAVGGDGTVYFYVPLSGSGETYGVDGGGLSADRCYFPGNCGGGALSMYLYFEGLDGNADVSILFTDLDESGFNDPWFFLEDTSLFDGNGIEIDDFSITGNHQQQLLTFSTNFGNAPYLELLFGSSFDEDTPEGRYRNQIESLRATATVGSISEPGTFALLGLGIAAMGLARRRLKTRHRRPV